MVNRDLKTLIKLINYHNYRSFDKHFGNNDYGNLSRHRDCIDDIKLHRNIRVLVPIKLANCLVFYVHELLTKFIRFLFKSFNVLVLLDQSGLKNPKKI